MINGNLIAYDEEGNVWFLQGESQGDVEPHKMPVGQLKAVELEYGVLEGVSKFKYTDSNNLEILEYNETVKSDEINLALLKAEGVIE